jgi:hypothetical protein
MDLALTPPLLSPPAPKALLALGKNYQAVSLFKGFGANRKEFVKVQGIQNVKLTNHPSETKRLPYFLNFSFG